MSSHLFSSREYTHTFNPGTKRTPAKACGAHRAVVGTTGQSGPKTVIQGDATLFEINRRLDRAGGAHALNERFIEGLLEMADGISRQQGMVHWLIMARLMEAALMCAGHYADHCQFSSAGDLLANPRKIRVRVGDTAETFDKARHKRLTDQLAERCSAKGSKLFDRRDAACDIVVPALLPYIYRRLVLSGYFGGSYLDLVERRMTAVADTIGFLAAGQIFSNETLHQRIAAADPDERELLERHLCRFEDTWFRRFGHQIGRIQRGEAVTAAMEESG